MTDIICKGSLQSFNAKNSIDGYSKKHLTSFFGVKSIPHIAGDPKGFNSMIIDHSDGASISGVQRKMFMSVKDGLMVPSNQGEYIVKPAPEDLAHLPENEQSIMLLAKAVKFNVAQCSVLPFESGELAYVTKRFDIISSTQKFLIEDGASLCLVAPENKSNDALSYEKCVMQMVHACGGAHAVAFVLFRMVLFSYLVGNNDLHLKNFSFYRNPDNKRTTMDGVAPLYDVLSVAPYSSYDNEYISLSLLESETTGVFSSSYEAYGYYTFHDFLLFGESLGFSTAVAKKSIHQLKDDILKKLIVIHNSNLPDEHMDIVLKRINSRCSLMDLEIM